MRDDMIYGVHWTKPLAAADRKRWGTNSTGSISVSAGVANCSSGAQPNYWTVTGSIQQTAFGALSDRAGGCIHEEIVKYWPKLAPLVAMHLCDEAGAPLHAAANGWYNFCGCVPGNFGERYHAGNSPRNFPVTPPADKPYQTTEWRNPTPEECLALLAEHLRRPVGECAERTAAIVAEGSPHADKAKRLFYDWIKELRPGWRAESEAALALLVQWGAVNAKGIASKPAGLVVA